MRLAVAAATTLLLLTGVAHAQAPVLNLMTGENGRNPEQLQKDEEIDKAYKEKTRSQAVPVQPAVNDPWGAVRSSDKPTAQGKSHQSSKTR